MSSYQFHKYLVLALGLLCSFEIQAQQVIDVSGKVIDADSLQPAGGVHVFVGGENLGTITNENGFFSISISPEDTLIFSAVNYETVRYTLPDSLRRRSVFIEIRMKLRIIRLPALVVHGRLNPAALRRYLENLDKKKKADNPPNVFRNQPQSTPWTVPEGREHTVGFGNTLEGGTALEGVLTGLANLFNKRAQQQKRIAKLLEAKRVREAQQAYEEFIGQKFNERIVAEATGLSGARLEQFLSYCNLSDEFVYSATEYEILEAIFDKLYRFERQTTR